MLRLLILAHANRVAGPRFVARNLIRALARLKQDVQIIPVLPVGCGYEEIVQNLELSPIWFDQKNNQLRRFVFDMVRLPLCISQHQPDVILSLGSNGLLRPPVPQVILVQDPHFVYPREHFGNMSSRERARYFVQGWQLRIALDRSKLIYCQTSLMIERLRRWFAVDGRVKILPKCVDVSPLDATPSTSASSKVMGSHAGCYRLICLCRYYAHKNLEIVCDAFERHGDILKGVLVFLTIAVDQHPRVAPLLQRINWMGLADRIINLGPIDERDIPACYENCEGLLLPTLLESFSGAYLDAMHWGVPIVTSELDFARQVCGEAAIYFDPCSPLSMAEAVVRLKSDRSLQKQLAKAGQERLRLEYWRTWDDIATQVVGDIRELA